MELKWIKIKRCPKCGESFVVKEEKRLDDWALKHGEIKNKEETRVFACGQGVTNDYGNRDKLSSYHVCRNNDEYKVKIKKKQEAAKEILELMETLDVDDAFKSDIRFQVKWKGELK
jgi:hypothetical protein